MFGGRAEGMRGRRERKEMERKNRERLEKGCDRGSKISPITLLTKTLYDTLGLKTDTHTHTHTHACKGQMVSSI